MGNFMHNSNDIDSTDAIYGMFTGYYLFMYGTCMLLNTYQTTYFDTHIP